MMSDVIDRQTPRRIIREFTSNHVKSQEKTNDSNACETLEMRPVIEAVKNYGRKTHSLGALQGACAMQNLINEIRALNIKSIEIENLLNKGDSVVLELKSYLKKAYKELLHSK